MVNSPGGGGTGDPSPEGGQAGVCHNAGKVVVAGKCEEGGAWGLGVEIRNLDLI